ncbi:nuclease-related domain-containing protein [Methanonatronarchaeum sp. AMET-Sl]|uniref:nuclease-related domain-containing protein n=1 Tax=Methanonatronarchaeum sp. AMET-Sl TaxID=3037654 RepID=UPI00244DEC1A|nr:nuclease-related domain-containing protein [Methanonatronarchaeum sp. AMET-Sl]WGI17172.1 NERD domain-containing protein [Methanonatronarchaeum sp. AMET-Sl]
MAEIYGIPESEKEILQKSPSCVANFEDIGRIHNQVNEKLEKRKEKFQNKLPEEIKKEQKTLKEIKKSIEKTRHEHENKISQIKSEIKQKKNNKKWLSIIPSYIKIIHQKYISKPLNIHKYQKSMTKQRKKLKTLKENPEQIFKKQENKLIEKTRELKELKSNPFYKGAYGEIKTLKELSKLNNKYKVLCGLNIELDHYIKYNGKHNLKSAQMDFVVVSQKGIFLIEVKNWSNQYLNKNKGITPHEQLDRAGKTLYIYLNSQLNQNNTNIDTKKNIDLNGKNLTKILVPIQNNMNYNKNYKYVFVKNLTQLNNFITNRKTVYSQKETKIITNALKNHITKK